MVAGEKSKLAHACKAAPAGGEKCEKSNQNSGQKKQSWQDVLVKLRAYIEILQ